MEVKKKIQCVHCVQGGSHHTHQSVFVPCFLLLLGVNKKEIPRINTWRLLKNPGK